MSQTLNDLRRIGIVPRDGARAFLDDAARAGIVALDSAPVTPTSNAVPQWMLNHIDPKVVEVLLAPKTAEQIFKPARKGDIHTKTATFQLVETAGFVDAYGDFSNGGMSDVNITFPTRQSYAFETMVRWGDMQIQEWGEAKIDYYVRNEIAAANTLKEAHNRIWFHGVAGMENYGILNDPTLPPTISPAPDPDAANAVAWEEKTSLGIYNDFLALFRRLSEQGMGNVTMSDPLVAVMSNNVAPYMLKTNQYNVAVADILGKAFPNLRTVVAPEYATPAGETLMLVAERVDGNPTGELGYSDLHRSHGIVRLASSYQEKKSAGNWGAIIYYPLAIATMVGV